jgi:hypothetical protein
VVVLEDADDAATDVPRAEQPDGDAAHPTTAPYPARFSGVNGRSRPANVAGVARARNC